MAPFNEVENFFKCILITKRLCEFALTRCIEKSIRSWHEDVKDKLKRCETESKCLEYYEPKDKKSCNACIDWANKVDEVANNRSYITWSNVLPTKFYDEPVEVAKLFAFKAKKERMRRITAFRDFDFRSLLMIIIAFTNFWNQKTRDVGTQTSKNHQEEASQHQNTADIYLQQLEPSFSEESEPSSSSRASLSSSTSATSSTSGISKDDSLEQASASSTEGTTKIESECVALAKKVRLYILLITRPPLLLEKHTLFWEENDRGNRNNPLAPV